MVAGTKKVTRYIGGHEANISWYAGNLIPNTSVLGVLRLPLPEGLDIHGASAIQEMLQQSTDHGITQEKVMVIVGRPSVKVVGDSTLTAYPQNGVGNDLMIHEHSRFFRNSRYMLMSQAKSMQLMHTGRFTLNSTASMIRVTAPGES